MQHRVAFNISGFAGCEGAALQATGGADRPLCAFVSAHAAWSNGFSLRGTLAGCGIGEISEWQAENLAAHQVSGARVNAWIGAVCGQRHDFKPTQDTYLVPRDGKIQPTALDDYQFSAIRALTSAGGATGAFMGGGKTLMGTATASEWGKLHPGQRCWIFCPLNAMPAWEGCRGELLRHFAEVRLMSVDSAHKYVGCANTGGFLILDELHTLGEASARRTKAMHTIRSKFDFCHALTGTLVNAGVEKTLSFADLCVPGMALFSSRWKAGEHFACLVRKSIGSRTVTALEKPTTTKLPQFHAWLGRWAYLLKPDSPEVRAAFQLPEQHIHEIRLGEPWGSFESEVATVAHKILAETGELPHAQEVAHVLARAHAEEKIDWLIGELAEEEPDFPFVVFANYRDTLDLLDARFKEAGILYVRVDGDVNGADRTEAERRFQSGEVRAFIGQIHAASVSMNLQRARFSATIDVSWSPIDYPQALARTCRRGQTHECVHLDIAANRTQSTILARLRRSEAFSAECTEWQEIRRIVKETPCPMPL